MNAVYVRTKFRNTVNVPQIVTAHYYEFDRNFSFEGESHDFWELVYVDRGQIEVTTDRETLVLSQEELLFHKPNEFHAVRAYHCSPNFFVLSFTCRSPAMRHFRGYRKKLDPALKPIISSIIAEADRTYLIPKNDVTMEQLVLRDSAQVGGEQLIKIYLEQLLILLLRDALRRENTVVFPTRERLENHVVQSVKTYIGEHIDRPIRLEDICRALNYRKSYLCKVFREYSGRSPIDYANRQKIERAKAWIREEDATFSEIASRLSFDTPQYFSRVFKRYTGMSPTEFRASLRVEHG